MSETLARFERDHHWYAVVAALFRASLAELQGDVLEPGPPNRHTATEQPARGTGSLATMIQWLPWSWRITGLGCVMPWGDRKPHITVNLPSGGQKCRRSSTIIVQVGVVAFGFLFVKKGNHLKICPLRNYISNTLP